MLLPTNMLLCTCMPYIMCTHKQAFSPTVGDELLITYLAGSMRVLLDVSWKAVNKFNKQAVYAGLIVVQLEAARIATGCKSHTSHRQLYSELGWMKLSDRRESNKLKKLYCITRFKTPQYLIDTLEEMKTYQSFNSGGPYPINPYA